MVAPDTSPSRPADPHEAWVCRGCPGRRWFFGWVHLGRTLVERGGNRSTLPCVRYCPICGTRNHRLPD